MNRIKELRESKKITQVRLAIELAVSQETISAYENGKHYPSLENLIKLSKLFNTSCDYILGISDIQNIAVSKEFNKEEYLLISKFRSISPEEQNLVLAYIQGFIDKNNLI